MFGFSDLMAFLVRHIENLLEIMVCEKCKWIDFKNSGEVLYYIYQKYIVPVQYQLNMTKMFVRGSLIFTTSI